MGGDKAGTALLQWLPLGRVGWQGRMTRPGGCCYGGLWGEVTGKMPVPLCLGFGAQSRWDWGELVRMTRPGRPCYGGLLGEVTGGTPVLRCLRGLGNGSSGGFFAGG